MMYCADFAIEVNDLRALSFLLVRALLGTFRGWLKRFRIFSSPGRYVPEMTIYDVLFPDIFERHDGSR